MTPAQEALMWRGITPPPNGLSRTTCPQCSHTRRKHWERCLQVRVTHGVVEWRCRHCGWTDCEVIQ